MNKCIVSKFTSGLCTSCDEPITGPVHVTREVVHTASQGTYTSIPHLWCQKHCPACSLAVVLQPVGGVLTPVLS
jgi:hypothetical protein